MSVDRIINCPHCDEFIIINQRDLNCAIFRHAVYKENYQPINPHAPQAECETLVANGRVFGYAKPFRIIEQHDKWIIEPCDYI